MKKLVLGIALLAISVISNAQNVIEVTLSQVSMFSVYGKDSVHNMIKNTNLLPYQQIYDPINLRLIIDKKAKKVFRIKNNLPYDTLPIKKIAFKDSIYTITVTEKRDAMYAHYEGQMIDCNLVLDIRKNPINKKQPKFVYWWCWDIFINDEPMDLCRGKVSDYVTIK
jgi:hypothetical protein